ncbi:MULTISPECIES: gp16 family protein [Citromicrobium]|uniref:gp16 family protein n=1 Tax=Citromicrobium TaxID=72173 RepID=UPI0001DD10DE|nr:MULTISPECIES: regulatory protein GemA [Citromicrobium]
MNAATARRAGAGPHRRSMIAKIHVARSQLRMEEDDYRQIVFDASGKTSSADCSDAQLEAIIDALKQRGFKPLPRKGAQRGAQHPVARKARALWISLHQLGAVRNESEAALESFAKRQLGCERLDWARQSDGYRLIEALKNMAEREGWAQRGPKGEKLAVRQLQKGLCEAILSKLKAKGLAGADWSLDVAAYRLLGEEVDTLLATSPETYATLAAQLGRVLRGEGGPR